MAKSSVKKDDLIEKVAKAICDKRNSWPRSDNIKWDTNKARYREEAVVAIEAIEGGDAPKKTKAPK